MRVPAGFAGVTPYLFVEGAESYVEFLQAAFAGAELGRSKSPDDRIANCQVRISGSTIMLSEASEAFPASRAALYVYVENADASMKRAMEAGADKIMDVWDLPYGDRQGGVRDPAGNIWWISQRLTDAAYF